MEVTDDEGRRSTRRSTVTFGLLLSLVTAFFISFYFPSAWRSESVSTALAVMFLLSWIGMPIAVYADIRTVRATGIGWQPTAVLWVLGSLLPVLNVSVVIPYLLRRYEQVNRGESWDYWWRIAGGGMTLILVLIFLDILLIDLVGLEPTQVDLVLGDVGSAVFVLVAFLIPMAMAYDIAYIETHFEWEPERILWIAGSAVPLVNIVVVVSYIAKRNPESPFTVIDTDPVSETPPTDVGRPSEAARGDPEAAQINPEPDSPSEPPRQVEAKSGVESEPHHPSQTEPDPVTGADIDSRWWYWPAITVGLAGITFLLGIGVATGMVVGLDLPVFPLILVALLLLIVLTFLGYGSLLAIHYDATAIRETDSTWQPSVLGYLLAAVFLSPIVSVLVYVIQRHRYLGEP